MKIKLLLSVIAILFVAVLYLLYLNLQKPTPPVVSLPTPTVYPTVTSDPTANWKTYTNTSGSYSIRYPQDASLYVADKPSVSFTYIGKEQLKSGRTQSALFDGYKINISINQKGINETALSDITNLAKNAIFPCPNPDTTKVSEIKTININGILAYYFSVTNCIEDSDIYVIQNMDKIYTISLLYVASTGPQKELYHQTAIQILSTFHFSDPPLVDKFTDSTTLSNTPESIVKKYLDASVKGDLKTAKIYCPSIEQTAKEAYNFISYEITGSEAGSSSDYYKVFVKFTDTNGKVWDKAPHSTSPLSVMLSKNSGSWKAMTWYFYQ